MILKLQWVSLSIKWFEIICESTKNLNVKIQDNRIQQQIFGNCHEYAKINRIFAFETSATWQLRICTRILLLKVEITLLLPFEINSIYRYSMTFNRY